MARRHPVRYVGGIFSGLMPGFRCSVNDGLKRSENPVQTESGNGRGGHKIGA